MALDQEKRTLNTVNIRMLPCLCAAALCADVSAGNLFRQNFIGLDLPAIPAPPPGKADFIFKIEDTLSVLFYHYLEYESAPPGIFPCDGRLVAGPEEHPLPPNLAERCRFDTLRIFSKRGVAPLPSPLRFVVDTVDQCRASLRFRIPHAPVPEPLFISTWKGKGPFLTPKPVKLKPEGITRPPEAKSYSVKSYAHPRENSISLSVVHYRHTLPPMDDGYTALPARVEWAGQLYLNRDDQSFLLTETFDFGKSNLAGFMDVNGDGVLDILIGNPVELILERYGDGFRIWWWPDEPSHGC